MRSSVTQVPRSERVLVEAVQRVWQRSPAFLSQTHRISSAQPDAMWWSGQSADTAGSQLCPAPSAVTVIHFFHERRREVGMWLPELISMQSEVLTLIGCLIDATLLLCSDLSPEKQSRSLVSALFSLSAV